MTLKEMYESIGSNYDNVLGRLMTEALVSKFVFLFQKDDSFGNLETSFNEKNRDEAFRAAHTLKGVAQNLGFDRLYQKSSELTEFLRGREDGLSGDNYDEAYRLYEQVKAEHDNTMAAIDLLEKQDE